MQLPEPHTFFVDRALGKNVLPAGLRAAGLQIKVHDEWFAQKTPDATWLPEIGRRRWVLLTKDCNIRIDGLERRTLLANRVAAFMLKRGDLTAEGMIGIFVKAHDGMLRALRRFELALIASVSRDSVVRVQYADSRRLPVPAVLRPRGTRRR